MSERTTQVDDVMPHSDNAVTNWARQRARYGDLLSSGQREAAARRRTADAIEAERAQQACAQLAWERSDAWVHGTEVTPIAQFSDESLFRAVAWLVKMRVPIMDTMRREPLAVPPNWVTDFDLADWDQFKATAAAGWLCQQPLFIGLVRESIRRDMTYADATFDVIRLLFGQGQPLEGYVPWRDPARSEQPRLLRALLEQEDSMAAYGRPLRTIRTPDQP